jgi:hypothetical protein
LDSFANILLVVAKLAEPEITNGLLGKLSAVRASFGRLSGMIAIGTMPKA